jgi:hypothetical protein
MTCERTGEVDRYFEPEHERASRQKRMSAGRAAVYTYSADGTSGGRTSSPSRVIGLSLAIAVRRPGRAPPG